MLKIIKAIVLEKNQKTDEAKQEIFGVLVEMEKANVVDSNVHETFNRTIS